MNINEPSILSPVPMAPHPALEGTDNWNSNSFWSEPVPDPLLVLLVYVDRANPRCDGLS